MTIPENLDELEPRNGPTMRPPPLPADAPLEDVVAALNGLADAVWALAKTDRTHSVELDGIRLALHEQGTRIETFCLRIERAMGVTRNRDTDPAPGSEEG